MQKLIANMQIKARLSWRYRILLILALITAGLVPSHSASAQPPSISVIADRAKARSIGDPIEAIGTLQANELVEITTLTTERVTRIGFNDGARVEKGQMLVEFANGEEKARLEEIRAARREADAEFARTRKLAERNAASETELSERRRAAEVAAAQERAISAQIADRVIKAPFDGVVGIRMVSVGSTVAPGQIITRLVDDRIMKLDFSIPAPFLSEISVGTPITAMTRTYKGEVFRGKVASLDSVIDPVTRTLLVRAIIENDDRRLRPGLLMEIDFLVNRREAIVVDESALIPDGDKTYVYVAKILNDGTVRAEQRAIKVGTRRIGEVEVTSGLSEGESVIIEGALKLQPGTIIKLDGAVKRAASRSTRHIK